MLSCDRISWDPHLPSAHCSPTSWSPISDRVTGLPEFHGFLNHLDGRLQIIWADLSEFVRTVNLITQSRLNIDAELYHDVMISIHYRLINLQYDDESPVEALRLGMLAFASTLFLQWRGFRVQFKHLAECFCHALHQLDRRPTGLPLQLRAWLYIIGSISVLEDQERIALRSALHDALRCLQMNTWNEVRYLMKSILWIDFLHDNGGGEVVQAVLCKTA